MSADKTPSNGDAKPETPSRDEAAQVAETVTTRPETTAVDAEPKVQEPKGLVFDTDKGASRSTWIAAVLVILIVGWMGSGFVIPSEAEAPVLARTEPLPVSVAVATSVAEQVTQYYSAEGQALPDRDTTLRAETSGDIVEVLVQKGDDVEAGAVIARFDPANNIADANRAAEELARAQREFDNAEQLLERGVATADRVSQARATLASAQAQVTAVEQAAGLLTLTAPFAGRIETLDIDEGVYVSAGSEVGRLVDITPLTVEIQVSQQSLSRIIEGQPATVRFITGEEKTGVVTFVGSSASPETRTFQADVEVPNDDGSIPAGVSAEVTIPTGEVTAHFLAPSIVSLDTDGTLGAKTVDDDNVVTFYPIQIVTAQIDGVWVTGLPETVNLITVGQGFVNEGEVVAPRTAESN